MHSSTAFRCVRHLPQYDIISKHPEGRYILCLCPGSNEGNGFLHTLQQLGSSSFASASSSLTDFLFGNKLAKAVKYVEYAASGGREGDYFQTYFTVYVERLLPYNLVDCQALKQCNFPLNHEI